MIVDAQTGSLMPDTYIGQDKFVKRTCMRVLPSGTKKRNLLQRTLKGKFNFVIRDESDPLVEEEIGEPGEEDESVTSENAHENEQSSPELYAADTEPEEEVNKAAAQSPEIAARERPEGVLHASHLHVMANKPPTSTMLDAAGAIIVEKADAVEHKANLKREASEACSRRNRYGGVLFQGRGAQSRGRIPEVVRGDFHDARRQAYRE